MGFAVLRGKADWTGDAMGQVPSARPELRRHVFPRIAVYRNNTRSGLVGDLLHVTQDVLGDFMDRFEEWNGNIIRVNLIASQYETGRSLEGISGAFAQPLVENARGVFA